MTWKLNFIWKVTEIELQNSKVFYQINGKLHFYFMRTEWDSNYMRNKSQLNFSFKIVSYMHQSTNFHSIMMLFPYQISKHLAS